MNFNVRFNVLVSKNYLYKVSLNENCTDINNICFIYCGFLF